MAIKAPFLQLKSLPLIYLGDTQVFQFHHLQSIDKFQVRNFNKLLPFNFKLFFNSLNCNVDIIFSF